MIKHLGLKAYGKINLGLDVLRRREDGYHEVRMIMQTVGIFDRVDIIWKEEPGIQVETNLYYLPTNENNLVYKAAKLLMDEFGVTDGVTIKLKKFIPVAAGMAGGSSDAAAVLFGVNKMFRLGLTIPQLMERGVKIGADVPYCILRGTALSEGIGEVLTPLPPVPQCQVLIAKPAINVSTKFVYENLHANDLLPGQHPDIDAIIDSIRKNDIYGIADNLGNVLETVTIKEYPVIRELKEKMLEYGAIGSLMSGSGPTVFGLFTSPKAAQDAYEELRYGSASNLAKQVYLTNFYNQKENQKENIHGTRTEG
ncbi:4-(cytidine 5'-diphospho)-2-C-methyl-D-erythritol kinase [Clostridium sp. AN503]|uniref:4-(cytidine 5'-diphospho)-2-C-methyl-D-erythritol kinase n=1 Tax=Clostridium sp. AN503 TaxID=3160598 RepID=UPI0034598355